MGDTADIYRRHLRDRPIRGLTDEELRALLTIGDHLALFEAGLTETLGVIVELAQAEESDRVQQEMLARRPETAIDTIRSAMKESDRRRGVQ